ncbi:DndE family protein [uncultured Imperialibacter sp.]|uniref:DndE family protein n=1 Tax=uncultured Imperialibacter sp. TaxID=1672639 RepID=UPI0030DAC61C|tara:strand:- start:177 stop:563 length:387 start_codon:yes stop_codon:yes gene_type:complete
MFNTIKTSKENKERVIQLTRKLNLGAENVIARLAFGYSLSKERTVNLAEAQDSQGKEYSYKVLFGDYGDFYMAMICVHYNLHISDKDLARYVKMHIDDGLELLDSEFQKSSGAGTDFLIQKIDQGLSN